MFHEFGCRPEETRNMDANNVKTFMEMLALYKAITESEQSKTMKGLFTR